MTEVEEKEIRAIKKFASEVISGYSNKKIYSDVIRVKAIVVLKLLGVMGLNNTDPYIKIEKYKNIFELYGITWSCNNFYYKKHPMISI